MLVALLAEGVDRNVELCESYKPVVASPSSRRAWIEILASAASVASVVVALLAEGVDRNCRCPQQFAVDASRPPRGGRG